MASNNEIICQLPKMLSGDELLACMRRLPNYDKSIRNADAPIRLMELSNLYDIYIPNAMSTEIYSKLYLAMLRSLQKKNSRLMTLQQKENGKAINGLEYCGIMGGSDSFTIIGASGIGKSTAIATSINVMEGHKVIEIDSPYMKVIPCLIVQCPFDSSVKGLLLEVLRKVDERLETKYHQNALRTHATIDMLIGIVSEVALLHIGLLIVDEIQHVCTSKNGKNLVGMLTQLINNSGISIGMVGTPKSNEFFTQEIPLARRSLGLEYKTMPFNDDFHFFCKTLYEYQYTNKEAILDDGIIEWLYEHTAGIAALVVGLIHDAQELAILNGSEILNKANFVDAYKNRLSMMHDFISPSIVHNPSTSRPKDKVKIKKELDGTSSIDDYNIIKLADRAKTEHLDMLALMREHFQVEEVLI